MGNKHSELSELRLVRRLLDGFSALSAMQQGEPRKRAERDDVETELADLVKDIGSALLGERGAMLVPNFSVVNLARKDGYRDDGDAMAASAPRKAVPSSGKKYVRNELSTAYKGKNSYGGDEAEIYAYRVLGCNPQDDLTETEHAEADKILQKAIKRLRRRHPDAVVLVDGSFLKNRYRLHAMVHREKQ